MAVKIELKRSAVPGKVPSVNQLDLGELAINTYDGKVYFKQDTGVSQSIIEIASSSGSIASASYAQFAATAGFASYASQAGNANTATSASYSLSGSYAISSSYAFSASHAPTSVSASYALTASYAFTASSADDFFVRGTLTAQTIVAQIITSSTEYITGSTIFGSQLTDRHQFTGSVTITGSLFVNGPSTFSGSVNIGNLTGSLYGTSSWSVSSSIADTASLAPAYTLTSSFNAFTGSYLIDSASFSSSIASLSSSFLQTSASLSSSIALLSGSFLEASASLSSSIALLSGSFLQTSASLSASIQLLSGSFLAFSQSYTTASFTGSFTGVASVTGSITGNGTLTGSFTGSFAGYHTGIFSGSIANINGTPTYVPIFDTANTLSTSSIFQSGAYSVIINQTNNTTDNPEALYVWQPSTSSFNVISGKGNLNNYLQLNIQNTNQGTNASSDVVATANNGDEEGNYVNMGINSENYSGFLGGPNDAYVYNTGSEFHIGNASPNKHIGFFAGGPDVIADNKLTLNPNNQHELTGSLNISSSLIVNEGITGSLYGTASWALNTLNVLSSSYSETSSFAFTSSFTLQTLSSSYAVSSSNSISSSYALTASFALNVPDTASFAISSSYALSSSNSISSSYAISSSNAISSSYSLSSSVAVSSSYAISSSNSISSSYAISGSNSISSSFAITASYALNVPDTASFAISSSYAISASNSISSSYAITSSYSQNSTTSSYAVSSSYAQSASYSDTSVSSSNAISSSYAISSSNAVSASYAISASAALFSISASYALSASQAASASLAVTASHSVNALSASYAATASSADDLLVRYNLTASNALINGTITAQTLVVQTVTSSVIYSSGSNTFGNDLANRQIFTGSVSITGSLTVNGPSTFNGQVTANNLTGSLFGTASWALNAITASHAVTALSSSYAISSSAALTSISSSYAITASHAIFASSSFSSSYAVTSSNAVSSSYALSSSNSVSASYAISSSNTVSSSYAISASNSISASYAISSSNSVTASYAISSSNTVTASYALNAGLLDGTGSRVFATTGSNVFIGNQTVTGSLFTTGSNTLIGITQLTGSLNVSGSEIIKGYIQFEPVTTNINTSISASYIYVSGSTNDLYFAQNSAGYSNTTRLRWLEGNLYTGLLNGGLITTQSSTVYQISSGSGIIVNLNASLNDNPYPTIQYLNWGNLSASIAPLTASYQQAFVSIDSTGNIYQQGTPFVAGQFNTEINIGVVLFQNQSTINGVKTQPSTAYGFEQSQNIFNRAFGPLKLSGFTLAPSGSSTGSLIVGSGTAYSPGSNYIVDPNNPSYATDPGTNTSKIFRYYQSGSTWVYQTNGGAGFGAIDPTQYSNNGTLTAVPSPVSSNWTIQRVFWFPNSVAKAIVVYYGNNYYGSESEAIANINIESFVEAPNTAANAIYLGAIVINGDGVFTDANDFTIVPGGLFRSVGGSGGGGSVVTQTLAGLSDVAISGPTNLQPFVYSTTAGKWINSSAISASVAGNATSATSASFATTASYAISSSAALQAVTASYVLNAISASYAATASSADDFLVRNNITASNALINGTITAQTLVVQTVTSSVIYSSGSNTFGNDLANRQIFTGSVSITGSLTVNGPSTFNGRVTANNLTGSLFGTSSWALNAITASHAVTALSSSYAISSSFAISSSYALSSSNAVTASHALTAVSASYAISSSAALQSISSSYAVSASAALFANTASFVLNAVSASFAATASSADAFNIRNGVRITGSIFQSGSGVSAALIGSGSGVFTVDGTSGRLFQVDDTLSGSLFSVNTVSGLPIIEAFSDNTVRIGQYGTRAFYVSQSAVGIGKENALNGKLDVSGSAFITGSLNVSSGITGSLFGTASYALNALSASFAVSSSLAVSSSYALSASFAISSSRTVSSSFAISASNAISASFSISSSNAVSSSFAISASNSISSSFAISASYAISSSNAISSSYAISASAAIQAITASYVLNAISASFASTASSVNTLNQNVVITGSLTVGSGSVGNGEHTLIVGPSPAGGVGEGGQILLSAVGGIYTSASMLDNYQNQFRVLRGTNAGSDAQFFAINLHSGQAVINRYTGSGAFPGTTAAFLAVDTSGNVLTSNLIPSASFAATASSADDFLVRQNITASNALITNTLTAQTLVVQTVTSSVVYSSGSNIFGNDLNNRQIFTGSVSVTGSLTVNGPSTFNGRVTANNLTGSLFGTSSWALNSISSSYAVTASHAINVTTSSYAVSSSYAINASSGSNFVITNTYRFNGTLNDSATVASSIAGTNNLFTQDTGSFTSGFFKYTVTNGANARTGQVMAVWNGGNVEYTDYSTVDIGSTLAVSTSVSIVSAQVQFNVITNTSGWNIKSLAEYM